MKVVRAILLSLLASLLFGFVVGTIIRMRLEPEPARYFLGDAGPGQEPAPWRYCGAGRISAIQNGSRNGGGSAAGELERA